VPTRGLAFRLQDKAQCNGLYSTCLQTKSERGKGAGHNPRTACQQKKRPRSVPFSCFLLPLLNTNIHAKLTCNYVAQKKSSTYANMLLIFICLRTLRGNGHPHFKRS